MWHDCDLVWQNRRPNHLDEEEFALLGHAARTVGEFAGKSTARHRILALNRLASLAGCDTRRGGKNHFVHNELCLFGMLFEIVGQSFADSLVHSAHYFAVAEFCLGLSLKLGLRDLDTDNCGESFAEVFAGDFDLCFLDLLLCGVFGVFLSTRVTAARKPARCVPPSIVLMLFTYE